MEKEKQRERLVELIAEFENNLSVRCPKYDEPTCEGCEYDLGDECDKTSVLADYLMSNNVVVLPCNVGDKVYVWLGIDHKLGNIIIEDTVTKIGVTRKGLMYENGHSFEEFGKTVFLSRAEAEAKLKEMQNGN